MSFTYLQEREAGFLAECSSGTLQFAPSKSNRTAEKSCFNDSVTVSCRDSQSGTMCEHSTGDSGADILMLSAAASHARTFPAPGKAQGSTESEADYGQNLPGLLAKYDRDSRSWKTVQCSLVEGLDEFSETWPRSGTMRNGCAFQQPSVARTISATASGFWPTPRAGNPGSRPNGNGGKILEEEVKIAEGLRKRGMKMYPTPTVHNAKECNAPSEANRNEPTLASRVGGRLNPPWVEWLMGWPIGWTDCAPLAMDKFQSWRQQHSVNL